jgi:hypothetical protein
VLSLLVGSCLVGVALCACPPAGFDSVANLDLVKYMTGPWYSQQQVGGQLCSAPSAARYCLQSHAANDSGI